MDFLPITLALGTGAVFGIMGYRKCLRMVNTTSDFNVKIESDPAKGVIVLVDKDIDVKMSISSFINPIYNAFDKPNQTCALIDKVPEDIPIKLIIFTKGGSLTSCEKIAKKLKKHTAGYKTYIAGECYSAGALLALGSDEIIMGENSYIGKVDTQVNEEEIISYIKVNAIGHIGPHNAYNYIQAQKMLNHSTDLLKLLFGSENPMVNTIKDIFIMSDYPHCKLFDFDECEAIGLPVRRPVDDTEKQYLNIISE